MISSRLLRLFTAAFVAMLVSACHDNTLLDNLSQQQANQVLSVLQQHDIQANKKGSLKGGYTISVASTDATAALSVLTQYQLPGKEDVQIAQAFPESSLVSSPMAEQVRVLSLEEQRLEQSLRIIPQVINAKVHIGYPDAATAGSEASTPQRIGVLITYSGELSENLFISQVKELIKNSLQAIRYDNISVVMFQAAAIQHAPPTPARPVEVNPLIWLCGALLTMLLLCGGFLARKVICRKLKPTSSTPDNSASVVAQGAE